MGLLSPWAKVENERPLADITALKQEVDDLKRQIRGLKLEWENVYDKLMKAAARINARHRRQQQEEPPPADQFDEETNRQPTPTSHPEHGFGSHEALTAARGRRGRPA